METIVKKEKNSEGILEAIRRHSDYGMADPYWIALSSCDVELSDEVKQQLSDYLNEWFEEHGPDANDDFTKTSSCLMTYETAEKAVKYACEKVGLDEMPDYIIDGVGSVETDGRENDPATGELLHGYPIHASSIIDELECLKEENELYKDDWRFIDMAFNSYECCSHIRSDEEQETIYRLISELVDKFDK